MRKRQAFGRLHLGTRTSRTKSTLAACTFGGSRRASTRDSFSHAFAPRRAASERPSDRRVHACASVVSGPHVRTGAVPAGMRLSTSVRSHGTKARSPVEHLSPRGSATTRTTGDPSRLPRIWSPFGHRTRGRAYTRLIARPYLSAVVPRHDGSMH